ncbi:DUF1423 domain-containing protein [Cephalotus follicularis]|uniref:DUF1423 domain-containing protein n=1 Tax=Cephalotus follicularis TaxID=3775 RepID=A0A1Q3CNL2_CEPFO|nr:DUF1423 domain-containing protein [Cephalotus follicularis]
MDIVKPEESNESTPAVTDNGVYLRPVPPDGSGIGLPYAPVNWPCPGDNWRWRVGKRVAITGHYLDRYLYLPSRLCSHVNPTRKRHGFASKLSVERYIRSVFPGADIHAFFASFSWKIPSNKRSSANGNIEGRTLYPVLLEEVAELPESDSQSDGASCKAGNKMCGSLVLQAEPPLAVMPCDICCSEPLFCRDCCCILCCKTINLDYGGYSYIKCEAMVGEGYICGHVAHLNCALRSYMAGTVGGSIGLDAEYYCRRCDAKTDLLAHVTKLLQTCESINSRDDIEKILNVGVCILRGSQKTGENRLLNRIKLAIAKQYDRGYLHQLKHGTSLEDIWKVEDNDSVTFLQDSSKLEDNDSPNFTGVSHNGNAALEHTNSQDPLDARTNLLPDLSVSSDFRNEIQMLDDEIDQVLQALSKSQEAEYKIAEEMLYNQKTYLRNLYQQLEKERSDLARRTSRANPDTLLNTVLERVDQINREVTKLKEMERVGNGFGKTSKGILKEHFDLDVEDYNQP